MENIQMIRNARRITLDCTDDTKIACIKKM